jgi:uncharacterized membrane protein
MLLALSVVAALGAGLIAGFFFAFSACVMEALSRLQPSNGIAAMQSINVVVLNPLFLGAFFGTAIICIILSTAALLMWSMAGMGFLIAGSLFYLVGAILVTVAGNVPLNNKLAAVERQTIEGQELWGRYLSYWTGWNHVRTIASLVAMMAFMLAAITLA